MLNLKSSHSTAFTPSSPAERYAEALASGQFMADEAQAQAVQELDRVWKELLNRYKASKKLSVVSAVKLLQKVYICGRCRTWQNLAYGPIL